MNKNIIIFGATGQIGVEICSELDSVNIPHTAFVRKGSEVKLKTPSTKLIYGDALNFESVSEALASQQFTDVIISLGSRDLKATGIRYNGTHNIIKAIKLSGKIPDIHVISADGVGGSKNNLNWKERLMSNFLIPIIIKDHEFQEEVVTTYQGKYHIIRPVTLTNSPGTGQYIVNTEAKLPNNKVSSANVAKYIVSSVLENKEGIYHICDAT